MCECVYVYGCESVYVYVIVCVCVSLWVREYLFVCVTCMLVCVRGYMWALNAPLTGG